MGRAQNVNIPSYPEPEYNNKSIRVDIVAARGLDNISKWITYFFSTT